MVDKKEENNCCGCRSCEQACPQQAITMIENEKGFRFPHINYSLCTKCGLCDVVCGFTENYPNHGDAPQIYAVKNKDTNIRMTSTSGGIFVAISDYILDHSGVVYGVGYGTDLYVCHKRAETKAERDEFKGSKYVQSDTLNTYTSAKKDLDSGRLVLYTGTPCQISGLKAFLRKDYEKLITVDLLCHGTPSNKSWRDFLNVIEQDNHTKIVGAEFRNKSKGWHTPVTLLKSNDNLHRIKGSQSYFQLFNPNYMLMPACYNCKFKKYEKCSDITIADFWGIERSLPEIDDNKGVSLVLINSPKGTDIFEKVSKNLDIFVRGKEHCAEDQIIKMCEKNPKYDEFWENYQKHGMRYVMLKYTEYSSIRTFIKKAIRKIKRICKI
ncbi:MAG: Coenzyme F420 hydrogenase/dehydrogenase, beta subunit C-terminal domain [Clostridium sp.]